MARPTQKRKQMLGAFGERYLILEHDGGWLIYDKEGYSKRANALYIGQFYLSTDGTRYSFRGDYYNTVEELIKATEAYNKTLPFDAEIYNPSYRKHCMVEMALHDYLKGFGFKMSWGGNEGTTYYIEDAYEQRICTIQVDVKEDTTTGRISRLIPNSNKWTDALFTDLDSAIGAVNSILSMYCLSINAITMNVLNALTNSRASQVLDVTFDVKKLSAYKEDAKQKTIEHLEKELKRLKGE